MSEAELNDQLDRIERQLRLLRRRIEHLNNQQPAGRIQPRPQREYLPEPTTPCKDNDDD